MQTTNNSIDRYNQIEILRDQLRPTKSYQATTPPTPSVTKITNQVNGHEVNFIFYYKATKADMKNAHHATKFLENNLRNGIAQRKAHLANLIEPYQLNENTTDRDQEPAINSKNIEQLKHESEVEHELETN